MNKERAIQILVKVAKQALKKEIPTGISKLLISEEQLKTITLIQKAIKLLDTSKRNP